MDNNVFERSFVILCTAATHVGCQPLIRKPRDIAVNTSPYKIQYYSRNGDVFRSWSLDKSFPCHGRVTWLWRTSGGRSPRLPPCPPRSWPSWWWRTSCLTRCAGSPAPASTSSWPDPDQVLLTCVVRAVCLLSQCECHILLRISIGFNMDIFSDWKSCYIVCYLWWFVSLSILCVDPRTRFLHWYNHIKQCLILPFVVC